MCGFLILTSCTSSKKVFDPYKKFSAQQLQEDYTIYRNILEERHPSLYWYTPKTLMDKAFDNAKEQLNDSLTEYEFRKVLIRVNTQIQCGHTSVKASKKYLKYIDTVKAKTQFPLYVKVWKDTIVVVHNIYKNDTMLVRGTIIDSLNGIATKALLDTMYHYITADGNNSVAKNQTLSTGTWLGSLYTSLYGWKQKYYIAYHKLGDTIVHTVLQPVKTPADTVTKKGKTTIVKKAKKNKKEAIQKARHLTFDEDGATAFMELNSFSEKLQIKKFFRNSFRQLKKHDVQNLIIDLRRNSGGRVSNSNLLTKYLVQKPFKLADSLYAKTRKSNYGRYIEHDKASRLAMVFLTRKEESRYHFRYYEKHFFKPRQKNHFSGNVYILSGGNSFSASTLVMSVLKPQENVTIVGEPSGGAAYGNTAWFIPEVTLPNTKVRLRLPLFRLVINKELPHNGQGVLPEIYVGPDIENIIKGTDYKMEKVKEIIHTLENKTKETL